jgi:cysteine-rich repeat protein
MKKHLVSAALLLAVGVVAWECGGSGDCQSTCGNGKQECSEQCDKGPANGTGTGCSSTCTIENIPTAQLSVSYERLHVDVASYPGYPAPTPTDLGIKTAHVQLAGPTPKDEMWDASNTTQMMYSGIPSVFMPGNYQATITLLDMAGNPVTKPKTSMMVAVQVGTPQTIFISFTTDDYLKSYTGNFDFALHWGDMTGTCTTAGVNKQTIKMTLPGQTTPVAMMTTDTPPESLDGTMYKCFEPTMAPKYQEVKMMNWGHYDMYVTSGNMPAFCSKFDVFVGVGVGTPTYDLVVEPASTDGGACP